MHPVCTVQFSLAHFDMNWVITINLLVLGKVAGIAIVGFLLLMFILNLLFSPSFDYKDKHVVITGGSSGIGLAVSLV